MKWLAVSHYFCPVNENTHLPPLDAAVKSTCREPFRRVDRFIQLALLGSARCVQDRILSPDCGIYIGSGLGPIGNNIETQQQLIRDGEIPKPFNFINTLGASACFYVAKNLSLNGQNYFISRRRGSLQAVLSAATVDLSLRTIRQALVGVVEEVVFPVSEHRLRQGLRDDVALAEGSHWFLLQADESGSRSMVTKRFVEYGALEVFLKSVWCVGDRLCCASMMGKTEADNIQSCYSVESMSDQFSAFHDSLEAAWLASCMMSHEKGKIFLIDGDSERGWSLFYFGS